MDTPRDGTRLSSILGITVTVTASPTETTLSVAKTGYRGAYRAQRLERRMRVNISREDFVCLPFDSLLYAVGEILMAQDDDYRPPEAPCGVPLGGPQGEALDPDAVEEMTGQMVFDLFDQDEVRRWNDLVAKGLVRSQRNRVS